VAAACAGRRVLFRPRMLLRHERAGPARDVRCGPQVGRAPPLLRWSSVGAAAVGSTYAVAASDRVCSVARVRARTSRLFAVTTSASVRAPVAPRPYGGTCDSDTRHHFASDSARRCSSTCVCACRPRPHRTSFCRSPSQFASEARPSCFCGPRSSHRRSACGARPMDVEVCDQAARLLVPEGNRSAYWVTNASLRSQASSSSSMSARFTP
jgi:hypothetical protein